MDVAVIGSGPNGLAAAVVAARAGLDVTVFEAADTPGGGARTLPLFDGDVAHDRCSAVHPLAAVSPFFAEFDLAARGVELLRPEISYAHPLDDRTAGIAAVDLDATCRRLGADGATWRRLFQPLVERSDRVVDVLLSDLRTLPDPTTAALLAPRVLAQLGPLARGLFGDRTAAAMLAGVAAHVPGRQPSPAGAAAALLLGHLAHRTGWPIPRGGSRSIVDALITDLRAHGGRLHCRTPIDDIRQLSAARAVLADVSPAEFDRIAGAVLPARYRRSLAAFEYGPAACTVDYLVSEPVPWTVPDVGAAGTVHLAGDRAALYAAEHAVAAGRRAVRPFVLLSTPSVVDDTRGRPGRIPVWAYAHVPNADQGHVLGAVTAQIERFAPGFADTVLAAAERSPSDLAAGNANYVGGDIAAGAVTARRLLLRPSPQLNPYATPLPGVYLCSASTPPGPGVHGMSGFHAVRTALRHVFDITTLPLLSPTRQNTHRSPTMPL